MSGVNSRSAGQQWAGFASIGAGIIHGAAIGLHAVEGIAAGVADVSDSERVDLCNRQH